MDSNTFPEPQTSTNGTPEDALDASMRAQGVEPYESAQTDYFGGSTQSNFVLGDGKTFVTIKTMNEGDRAEYQNANNKEVRVQKASGDAILKMSQADERHALIRACVVDWNLIRSGSPVPFSKAELNGFLKTGHTEAIDAIEKACRKANPWLIADMEVADIDAEIESLQEMRIKVVAEQEAKNG